MHFTTILGKTSHDLYFWLWRAFSHWGDGDFLKNGKSGKSGITLFWKVFTWSNFLPKDFLFQKLFLKLYSKNGHFFRLTQWHENDCNFSAI